LVAIVPVLVTAIALVLSIFCIYAGHNQSMMQDYYVFSLNTSRIGENMVHKLEDKILSFQLSDIGLRRRADLVVLPATPTMVPTTLITMTPVAPRNIFSGIGSLESIATHHIGSDLNSLKSKGGSEVGEATAYLHSKATSIEGAVASEASSIVQKIEDEIIKLINEAYTGLIEDIHLKDFYNIHVMANCDGTYVFGNGTNVTVGESGPPAPSGPDSVHQHIDSCEQHSAVDPMSLIKVVYWTGIVFIALAFLGSIGGVFSKSRKLAALNFLMTLLAFVALALASAVTHALALAATKVIDFLGSELGLSAYLGRRFLSLTWASTGLLGLNMVLAIAMFMLNKRWGAEERSPRRMGEQSPDDIQMGAMFQSRSGNDRRSGYDRRSGSDIRSEFDRPRGYSGR
jgi:hypothetical protein